MSRSTAKEMMVLAFVAAFLLLGIIFAALFEVAPVLTSALIVLEALLFSIAKSVD